MGLGTGILFYMLEARQFVKEIDTARKLLEQNNALFKGEYVCRDIIFSPRDISRSLGDKFLRLRVNEKNIWNEKYVIVAIKQTEKKEVGKNSIIPLRKEFDSEVEARGYIEKNLSELYKQDFEFTRTGWQYDLGEDQVDLERVENLKDCYTIEIKSPTEAGLKRLATIFGLTSPIQGPIVVAMKVLLA